VLEFSLPNLKPENKKTTTVEDRFSWHLYTTYNQKMWMGKRFTQQQNAAINQPTFSCCAMHQKSNTGNTYNQPRISVTEC